jgi:beta-glucosidase
MTDIARLVERLDLDQKIAQLHGVVPMDLVDWSAFSQGAPDLSKGFPYDLDRLVEVRPHGVGHLSLGWQLSQDLDELTRQIATFQEIARDLNPLGIATLVHAEGISGLVHPQGHQFATAWGQASTWDPETPRLVGQTAADQARAAGIHLLFSPVFDIARDIRWGRVHETYGEDPELVTRMGCAFVRGVQGEGGASGVLATGKHFLGYGHSLGGLNQAATQLGRRELVDVYAEPFRRAISEAGLSLIMNSYNELDGIPAAASSWLLDDLLRGELGFEGLVVSDYGSIAMLARTYRTAPTPGDAAAQALTAGIDVELPSADTMSDLRRLVEDGSLPVSIVDRAVARVLSIKARLGLVPEVGPSNVRPSPRTVPREDAEARARAIATTSITLLANDGVLPLDRTAGIAVVGRAADDIRIHFGAYSSVADAEMPIAIARILSGEVPGIEAQPEVFPDLFQTRLPGVDPLFEDGARRLHPEAQTVLQAVRSFAPGATYVPACHLDDGDTDLADHDALLTAVEDAEAIIAVVGERTGWVGNHTAGEGRTVADPTLPGDQNAMLATLRRASAPVVTVVVSGRPLLLETAHDASAAVVLAPLLGPFAGPAVADVLFGVEEPGGRSPSTFPRHVGQLPMYHCHPIGSGYSHPSLPRLGYTDLDDSSPLYPFGHGLTYTDFEVELDATSVESGTIRARATVGNVGSRPGTAVLQLYARDETASVVRPVRQLLDFARVRLDVAETRVVEMSAPVERLAYTWPDGRRGVEAGEVTVLVGLSSDDIRADASIEVPEIVLDDPR